jgi:hypothetical protein
VDGIDHLQEGVTPILCIVGRQDLKLFDYLKQSFASSGAVEVIPDRRRSQRRWRETIYPLDRRSGERRKQNIDAQLQSFGWVLVRRVLPGISDGSGTAEPDVKAAFDATMAERR